MPSVYCIHLHGLNLLFGVILNNNKGLFASDKLKGMSIIFYYLAVKRLDLQDVSVGNYEGFIFHCNSSIIMSFYHQIGTTLGEG